MRDTAAIVSDLAGEPRFKIFDAGLERRHVLLQVGQVARKDLAATAFVSQTRFYPTQPLRDRVVLLLKAFEPTVDLVEVAEHFAPQLGDLPVDLVEAAVDLRELPAEELNQLFVLTRGHGPMTIAGRGPTQVYDAG